MNAPAPSTYPHLEQAYKAAYAEADKFDDLNRALVEHYVARSSKAAAGFLRRRGPDDGMAKKAEDFAGFAAEQDRLSALARLGKFIYKILPGGIIVAAGLAAVTFFLTLLAELNQGGESVGAGVAGLAVSGGFVFFVARALFYAVQGAVSGGKILAEALGNTIRSNQQARGTLAKLAEPERAMFGPAGLPSQAQAGRVIVNGSGPLLATLLALAIAIPVALGAAALAGVISGVSENVDTNPYELPDYTVPDYTTPEPFSELE